MNRYAIFVVNQDGDDWVPVGFSTNKADAEKVAKSYYHIDTIKGKDVRVQRQFQIVQMDKIKET
jgi:hypothetical protein